MIQKRNQLQRHGKQAKHALLSAYLPVWSLVHARSGHTDLLYVDGFAFTGWYDTTEDTDRGNAKLAASQVARKITNKRERHCAAPSVQGNWRS